MQKSLKHVLYLRRATFFTSCKPALSASFRTKQNLFSSATLHQQVIERRQFSSQTPPGGKGPKDASEQAAMSEAQTFMSQAQNFIDEITHISEWSTKVMESDKPVILDCYAHWCGPCRKLTPLLEELTVNHEGKFKLVKLNIDDQPQLSQGLKITKIPAVFLINKGTIIDTFVGVPNEKVLEEFIYTALAVDSMANNDEVIKDLFKRIEQYISEGQLELAEKLLLEGSSYDQWKENYGKELNIGLAYTQIFLRKDLEKAQIALSQVTESQKKDLSPYYEGLLQQINNEIERLTAEAQPAEEEITLMDAIKKNPADIESRYKLAEIQWSKRKNQEAINSLLDIVKIDRNWNNRQAYNLLIEIFNKLGAANEVVVKARKQLSKILF